MPLSQQRSPKWLNVALLILGFASGQGAMFIAQSWLLLKGRIDLVGMAGSHLSFAILALFLIDSGSITLLASHTREVARRGLSYHALWPSFWATCAFRLMLSLLLVGAILLAATTLGMMSPFTSSFALTAIPALLIWPLNPAGILDGVERSGVGGLTGAAMYIAAAVALPATTRMPEGDAGLLLGAAFSLGTLVAVGMQFVMLQAVIGTVVPARPSRQGLREAFVGGTLMLVNTLPGQLFFRFQIATAGALLGPAGLGTIVYTKQITNACTQTISFARRAEYIHLLERLSRPSANFLRVTVEAGKSGVVMSFAGMFAVMGFGSTVLLGLLPMDTAIGSAMLIFAPLIFVNTAYLSLIQGYIAIGNHGRVVVATQVVLWGSAAGTLLLAPSLGLAGFAIAEIGLQAVGALLLITIAPSPARLEERRTKIRARELSGC